MKNKLIYLGFIFFFFIACKKEEEICADLPEGWYDISLKSSNDVTFKDVYTTVLNNQSYIIGNPPWIGWQDTNTVLIRNGCEISGGIKIGIGYNGITNLTGVIKRNKKRYSIEGIFSYGTYNGGQGNPNPQWNTVTGTFEIKQK